jgi:hypothetical protein
MIQPSTLLIVVGFLALSAPAGAADRACGTAPGDWCPAPAGDPCGRHRNAAACRADPACYGMAYRGESMEACLPGERGFSPNCPTVGCVSTPPMRR